MTSTPIYDQLVEERGRPVSVLARACSPVEALVAYTAPTAARAARSASRFGRAFEDLWVLAYQAVNVRTWLP